MTVAWAGPYTLSMAPDDPPLPGKFYDIGGYRLHLQRQGSGRPVAVMDTGLGGNSLLWTNALPAVAAVTEAITFDRAGSGWSDPAPAGQRRTSRQLVAELRRLLLAAGAEPPYVLVGHSSGAIHMLVFAKHFPQEVAGMVLVEPSTPDMFHRVRWIPGPGFMAAMYGGLSALGRIGLLRWVGPAYLRTLLPDRDQRLPAPAWEALRHFAAQGRELRGRHGWAWVLGRPAADRAHGRLVGGRQAVGDEARLRALARGLGGLLHYWPARNRQRLRPYQPAHRAAGRSGRGGAVGAGGVEGTRRRERPACVGALATPSPTSRAFRRGPGRDQPGRGSDGVRAVPRRRRLAGPDALRPAPSYLSDFATALHLNSSHPHSGLYFC